MLDDWDDVLFGGYCPVPDVPGADANLCAEVVGLMVLISVSGSSGGR